jgi:hypothetical protein
VNRTISLDDENVTIEKVKAYDRRTGAWRTIHVKAMDEMYEKAEKRLDEIYAMIDKHKARGEPQEEIDKQFTLALNTIDRVCEKTVKETIGLLKDSDKPFTHPALRNALIESEEGQGIQAVMKRTGMKEYQPRTKAILQKLDKLNEEIVMMRSRTKNE